MLVSVKLTARVTDRVAVVVAVGEPVNENVGLSLGVSVLETVGQDDRVALRVGDPPESDRRTVAVSLKVPDRVTVQL